MYIEVIRVTSIEALKLLPGEIGWEMGGGIADKAKHAKHERSSNS